MQALRFRPCLIPTLATLVLAALFIHLGQWQAGKGEQLAARQAQIALRAQQNPLTLSGSLVAPQDWQDMPVQVHGTLEPERQFFVDNQQRNGVAGMYVVTPLKISGSDTRVLVNRGWVAWPDARKHLPQVFSPSSEVEIRGTVAIPNSKKFFLISDHAEAWPQLWPRLDWERFRHGVAYPLQPVVVLQTNAAEADGLQRSWEPPPDKVAMHQSYAWQWYGMTVALLLFYVYASVHRGAKT